MITTKQRAKLKSLAQSMKPVLNIGKDNLNENTITEIEKYLAKNELMKIKILQASTENPKDVMEFVCQKTNSEPVLVVGKILVIYKFSSNKGVKHILENE